MTSPRLFGLLVLASLTLSSACERFSERDDVLPPDEPARVTGVPASVRARLNLASFYERYSAVNGFPIVSSRAAQNVALLESGWIIEHMLAPRPDILAKLSAASIRVVVLAPDEVQTDLPESADLWPRAWINQRLRARGPAAGSPLVVVGEENLLGYRGDPSSGSQMIHELAHAIHSAALADIDPTFDGRLRAAYGGAISAGLWRGTYTAHNHAEYWATGVEAWFDAADDAPLAQGGVSTREAIRGYDSGLTALLAEVFGEDAWRLPPIASRRESGHLVGFDPSVFSFRPPPAVDIAGDEAIPELALLAPSELRASPSDHADPKPVMFINQSSETVSIELVDQAGARWHRFQLRSAEIDQDVAPDGTIWAIKRTEDGAILNAVVSRGFSKVVIRPTEPD